MGNAVDDDNPRLSGRGQDLPGPLEGLPLVHDGVLRHVPGGEIRHEQRCLALVQCDLGHTSPPTLSDDPCGGCAESLRIPGTHPVLLIIPEHQGGLHTREASETCQGFTPPTAFDTPCRTESAHRTCRDHKDMVVRALLVPKLGEVDQWEVCLPGSVSALVGTPDSPLSPSA